MTYMNMLGNPRGRRSVWADLLILFGVFVAMMCITLFGASVFAQWFGRNSRASLFITSTLQCILAFGFTSYLTARFVSPQPGRFLGLDRRPKLADIFRVLLVYIIGLPAMNQIIYWNGHLSLPESMSGLEETLRHMEESNGAVARTMLDDPSWSTLIFGVLVVGLLTGLAEELLFRGALQGILAKTGHRVMALWVSAFIFSAVHFQFFGFVPRLLLGAWFGMLMLRTGSIWTSTFAHALNNSIVVVCMWLAARGYADTDVESWGVAAEGFPWRFLLSAAAVAVLLWPPKGIRFTSKKQTDGKES